MDKFKFLYKSMYDDLKDADELICHAYKLQDSDKSIADELARDAKDRLDHFVNTHKLFKEEAQKNSTTTMETVSNCLWDVTHEHMQEWYAHIEKKIKEY